MPEVVIFDMDRTLVRKDTAGLFIRYEWDAGLATTRRLLNVAWWRLQYTLGVVDGARVARSALEWYRGRNEQDLREHAKVWFSDYAIQHIGARARATVQRYRERGALVIMATAATEFVSTPVAEEFGIEHVVCSELEIADGKLTGNWVEPICYHEGKVTRLAQFLAARGLSLASATAYTDSVTDLPLLDAVSTPVVVNPDPRLRQLAQLRNWPIERW